MPEPESESEPSELTNNSPETTLNKPVFWTSLVVLLSSCAILLVNPEASLEALGHIHTFMTHDMGWLFLAFVFLGIIWLFWLAFSEYGQVLLGEPGCKPTYSNVSWFGMLFCAGIGSNLLYFGTTEWIGYYLSPPPLSGVAAQSPEAADWAGAYSFFHWGIASWAIYAMATLPIAYILHVKQSKTLRISTTCEEVLGEATHGPIGKIIDIFFIFGLVGGIGTSLGIGIPMLSAVGSDIFGFERGFVLDTGILIVLTAIFSFSVSAGLDKGIKRLSDINVVLAIILLGFFLLAGPTSFIINQAFDSLGIMFQNFLEMSLHTGAGNDDNFSQENTIFFWAWWMAWAPFMGLFVARISKGRTIKQVVLGCVLGGSLACWTGFSILGHTTMDMVTSGHAGMNDLMAQAQATSTSLDTPQMVVELLNNQPLSTFISAIFFVLSFIFVATSLDSAAFTLSATASDNLSPDDQPARWHRLLWAFILAGTALSLMYLGGLKILQVASIVLALPLVGVIGMMIWSLMKQLKKHHSD